MTLTLTLALTLGQVDCEVYSSLKGIYLKLVCFYQDRNALLKTLKPVITLPEYGLMPITEIRQRIYVKCNILKNILTKQMFINSYQSP